MDGCQKGISLLTAVLSIILLTMAGQYDMLSKAKALTL